METPVVSRLLKKLLKQTSILLQVIGVLEASPPPLFFDCQHSKE